MINDLEILKKLEKELGFSLKKVKFEEIHKEKSYSLNEQKEIIGLNLRESELKSIPSIIFELKNLQWLYLSSNQISVIPTEIKELINLQGLDSYSNQISSIPLEITELINLQWLYLSSNQISVIPTEIKELINLQELYLSSNQISVIPTEIKELINLQELHLYSNQISSIPVEIKELKKLQVLTLENNQLSVLPEEILELNLEIKLNYEPSGGIFLDNNPLIYPPLEMVKQGRKAVEEYFKSPDKQTINEVKVLLVGDGGAGKTCLVKRIFGEGFDEHEAKTAGISIREKNVLIREEDIQIRDKPISIEDRQITLHFWDFGGQVMMHATHQFFFSERSLYVLVLDGRKEEDPEYWLKLIESFGGDSPILVVLNKMDQHKHPYLNRPFYQEKYKNIKGFYEVSCRTDDGINKFFENLSHEVNKVKIHKIILPNNWLKVKEQMENMHKDLHKDFISIDEYEKICKKEKITEESSQNALLGLLNDLGSVVHFEGFRLASTHVLEPRWVTQGVYKIINSEELADSKGILKLNQLNNILKKKKKEIFEYPPDKQPYIIELMQIFKLCFPIDKETVLIPALLEIEEPKFDFDYKNSIKFLIKYDFLPESIIPEFMVTMHKDVKENPCWRTGMVLEDKNFCSKAVIKLDKREKKIFIYVNGTQRKEYLAIIRHTFLAINSSFESLKYEERVSLSDNFEATVKFNFLKELEEKGIRGNYYFEESSKEHDIDELLGSIKPKIEDQVTLEKIFKKLEDIFEEISKKSKEKGVIDLNPAIFGMSTHLGKIYLKKIGKAFKNGIKFETSKELLDYIMDDDEKK